MMKKIFIALFVVCITLTVIPKMQRVHAACGAWNECHDMGGGQCGRGQVCGNCADGADGCPDDDEQDNTEICECPGGGGGGGGGGGEGGVQTPAASTSTDPLPCSIAPGLGDCPTGLKDVYTKEPCVATYAEFKKNPLQNHFWALDEGITSQGKANERARQFIYWVMSRKTIDDSTVISSIWRATSNVALFLFILASALFGIGYIVGQQSNFELKIQIWPTILKIVMGLLYIMFSFSILITIVQISDILMKFFVETLGGDKLFNIYFTGSVSQEKSYTDFVGCRDLNYKVQEAINAELTLLQITNITYYVMGIMLLLRKVLIWFLLFVSPFLALLMPFVFIRNIGWIWIGVFFQWVFYGPLFALFLGGLARIWQSGIPFHYFDFSRVNSLVGYVYPTGINITYGGPAQVGLQKLSALNNGNYVDTFTEYIITLVMLWAVTIFPWWLLRIFRDYCCDGINAMKNILMSMYDQSRTSPNGPKPPPIAPAVQTPANTSMKVTREVETQMKTRMETVEQIKQVKTEQITKNLNLSMNKITDIARFETNKQTNETVRKNIEFLQQPTKASSPVERQKFMNIRTELFNRSVKQDNTARQILSSISSSQFEQSTRKQEILKTVPHMAPMTQVISYKTNVTQDKVSSVSNSFLTNIAGNTSIVDSIAKNTSISATQIQTVLSSYKQNLQMVATPATPGQSISASLKEQAAKSPAQVVANISKQTGLNKEKVITVIKEVGRVAVTNKDTVKQIAVKENLKESQVEQIIAAQTPLIAESEKNVEQTVSIPPSISIEDYEEVKKMWTNQYEKGEVPVSENLSSREEWVEQDILFITNTLNKLMSVDEKLKGEGVDDLGYILPIFLINNLKGEELVVYLKAKLEAAKHVKEIKEIEKSVTERLKAKSKDEEEFVDLKDTKKKEEAKHMNMEQELEVPGTPQSPTGPQTPIENKPAQ